METNTINHRELFAFGRLLVRSALLGAFVPVTHGEFWDVKIVQVVSALVVCLLLYGLEKAILWPFRKRLSIRPLYLAAYRGAFLYSLMSATWPSGNMASALGAILGAGLGGALGAMLLFKFEEGIVKLLVKKSSASTSADAEH